MKSIKIHGKEYVLVNSRIKEFRTNPKYEGFGLKTKKTLDQLVNNHNYYLLENGNLKNYIERLESKLKKLKVKNKEMKRIIYVMANTD